MRVLVACEYSGVVRDAFTRRGHFAMSCDLLPTESPGPHHQGNVLGILNNSWDLMIAHPPCTYLSYAANRFWNNPGRAQLREEGAAFFMQMVNAPIPRICVENPLGYMGRVYRKHDQIIHPYYFGEPFQKRTCLWLKGLPPLVWDKEKAIKPPPMYICQGEKSKGKAIGWCEGMRDTKGEPRWKARSKTFLGIAEAMANQWNFDTVQEVNYLD